MEASFDGPAALRNLQAAWNGGRLSIDDLAFRFETILWQCDVGDDSVQRDMPPALRDLVNQMELTRFTVDETDQPSRVVELLDRATVLLQPE